MNVLLPRRSIRALHCALVLGLILFAVTAVGCGDPETPSDDGEGASTRIAGDPSATASAVQPEPSATKDVVTATAGTILPETAVAGTPAPLPTATPFPPMDAVEVRLKYALLERFGSLWWCDPDFYPIAREDEQILAEDRFPEIERDAPTLAAIVAHLGYGPASTYTPEQKLAIYRDWKVLRALELDRAGDAYEFNARFTRDEQTGVLVAGNVMVSGQITVNSEEAAEPPMCPICLARGTRIATPEGTIAVEDLRAGMEVWTAGVDGQPMRAQILAVGMTSVPAWHRMVRLVLADGRALRASPSHPLADGRLIGAIAVGDAVDGAIVVSASSEPYDGGATFDLLPAGPTGTYWANGIALASTLVVSSPDVSARPTAVAD